MVKTEMHCKRILKCLLALWNYYRGMGEGSGLSLTNLYMVVIVCRVDNIDKFIMCRLRVYSYVVI